MPPDLTLWTLIVSALGSIATAVAAFFSWRSARVAAAAAKSAKEMAELEAGRRADEVRREVSEIYVTTTRSDPDWETRRLTVTLENHGAFAINNVRIDLIGRDSVDQTKIWRGFADVLASNDVLSDDIYFENGQFNSDGYSLPTASDGTDFGVGTDLDDFVWALVFEDHTGRHWQSSRRGELRQLSQRPGAPTVREIASGLGRDLARTDPKLGELRLSAPRHYPDVPMPSPSSDLPIRTWPRYLFFTGLERMQSMLEWLKRRW